MMLQTIEAVIDSSGNVHLLEPVHIKGMRRALVTILEELPASAVVDLPTVDRETSELPISQEDEDTDLSILALSAAYADDEPEYPLHLIKEWNPEYAGE